MYHSYNLMLYLIYKLIYITQKEQWSQYTVPWGTTDETIERELSWPFRITHSERETAARQIKFQVSSVAWQNLSNQKLPCFMYSWLVTDIRRKYP